MAQLRSYPSSSISPSSHYTNKELACVYIKNDVYIKGSSACERRRMTIFVEKIKFGKATCVCPFVSNLEIWCLEPA